MKYIWLEGKGGINRLKESKFNISKILPNSTNDVFSIQSKERSVIMT